MRKLLAIAALAALSVSTAAAQQSWSPELGIQAGYAKVKPAGSHADDAISLFDLPGANFITPLLGAPGTGSLYAVIPWQKKLAIEPQFSYGEMGLLGLTAARVGLRADYAIGTQFYGAAGGVVYYYEAGTPEHVQLGVQAALGYRRRLTNSLNGRVEANVTALNKKVIGAFDMYGLQIGVSSLIGKGKAAPAARRPSNRAWEPAIGVSGGYMSMHLVGTTTTLDGIFFPGIGGDLLLIPVGITPTVFAVIPVGQKLALEPGVDFHSVSQSGSSIKVYNLGARLDYAVTGDWYAAAGGHLTQFSPSSGTSGSTSGVDVAWGYRFHLAGAFNGRFEANYGLTGKSSKLGTPAVNTLSLNFGAMMPVK